MNSHLHSHVLLRRKYFISFRSQGHQRLVDQPAGFRFQVLRRWSQQCDQTLTMRMSALKNGEPGLRWLFCWKWWTLTPDIIFCCRGSDEFDHPFWDTLMILGPSGSGFWRSKCSIARRSCGSYASSTGTSATPQLVPSQWWRQHWAFHPCSSSFVRCVSACLGEDRCGFLSCTGYIKLLVYIVHCNLDFLYLMT